MDMSVEIKDVRGEFVIQTILNGGAVRFTLTIEEADLLAHKLQAQTYDARMARRNRANERGI